MRVKRFFELLLLLAPFHLTAASPYWLIAGPEVYHLCRIRDGGTHQDGLMSGFKVDVERIKAYSLYLGGEYLYATGTLAGATGSHLPMQSQMTDQIAEARIGFTFAKAAFSTAFITPFVGWGYFQEINAFCAPSPIPCTFTDSFSYTALGFLSGRQINPYFALGVNFKMRLMNKASSQIDDPFVDNELTLQMKEELHTRVDIPLLFTALL